MFAVGDVHSGSMKRVAAATGEGATRDLAAHQPAGALFGLAIGTNAAGDLVLYYTDSNTSTLHELMLQAHYAKQ